MVWSWPLFRFSSCRLSRRKYCKPLPNDVLVDIMLRLPIEDILRCKQVCRQWYSLIATHHFNDMHVNYGDAVSTVVVYQETRDKRDMEVLLFDQENRIKKQQHGYNKKTIQLNSTADAVLVQGFFIKMSFDMLNFSYHGLLLCTHYKEGKAYHFFFNPVIGEPVAFEIPYGKIPALFFHPLAAEYYVLWTIIQEETFEPQFKLLKLSSLLSNNLDLENGWKRFHQQEPTITSRISSFFGQKFFPSPVVRRDVVYWMAKDYMFSHTCETCIVIFDIKKEEFQVISHPGEICDSRLIGDRHENRLHLFEMEGLVSFCEISFDDEQLTMRLWYLEECSYSWIERETIILDDMNIKRFPFEDDVRNSNVKPVGTVNGEFIINWLGRGVFAYHLHLGSLRKLECNGGADYVSVHTKTALPVKNLLQTPIL